MQERDLTKGELTRQSILDAAVNRFGLDGFRATSVADIAREAAVSGSGVYAYFPNKEALFVEALDQDAAQVIDEGVAMLIATADREEWREALVLTLVTSLSSHPLAYRILAGREPDVTARVMDMPALGELRKSLTERLRRDQITGTVRPEIDATTVANGLVTIIICLLVGVVQFGASGVELYGDDVVAVIDAALEPYAALPGSPRQG